MLHRSLSIFATCALGATALILPPGIAPASSDEDNSLPSIVNPKSRLIQLPCPSCAFPAKAKDQDKNFDDLFWIQNGEKDVLLNFTISNDGTTLQLGGESIYAPHLQRTALIAADRLYVQQVSASASEAEIVSGKARRVSLEITSIGLSTEAEVRASPEGDTIVQLQLNITGLEGHFIQLDGVRIHLLKTSAGEFLILRMDIIPNSTLSPFPDLPRLAPLPPDVPTMETPDMKECKVVSTSFCKFMHKIETKIEEMRHGRPTPSHSHSPPHRPSPINSHNLDFNDPPPHRHGRPHHVRPHGSRYHRHSHDGFQTVTRGIITILIPVMAGITVGLLVSLLGLLVGRLIGFCWMQLHPERRRRYQRLRQRRRAAAEEEEEGKILLTDDDKEPLPPYEHAPAYDEIDSRAK